MHRVYLVLFALLLLCACSTQQPIQNVIASPVPLMRNGSTLTMKEVEKAIFSAAIIKGWKPTNVDTDTVEAAITVRGRHSATVDINYSQHSYDIVLKSSDGLDESAGKIHRNYNKWIILLDQTIQAELLQAVIE